MIRIPLRHFLHIGAFTLLVALPAAGQSAASGRLTGTITDEGGGVIPRAAVSAKNERTESEFKAVSNEVGVYVIPSVPGGSYTVSVNVQGFKTWVLKDIKVDAPVVTVDATMQIGFATDIIVTASKYEEEVINAPASATVIPAQVILDSPFQNVADLLRTVPGMNVAQASAVSFGVSSRSASGARAGTQLSLIDGRTIYQDWIGTTWWHMDTSLDDIKQMEVIRGPASAIWGSYAMNGVVNIITKSPREMIGTTFTLGAGTFDRSGGGAESDTGMLYYVRVAHAQALNDRWAFKFTGAGYTQDAFARPQGTIPNDYHTPYPPYTNKGTTQPRVDSRFDYDHPDGKQHFTFAGGYGWSSGVYPGGAGGADVDGGRSYGKVDYARGSMRITGYVNDLRFSGKYLVIVDAAGQPILQGHASDVYHLEFADYHTLGARHLISYGGNFRHARFDDTWLMPRKISRNEGGAYLQDEILLSEHFRWIVGARLDKFNSLKGAVVSPRTTFVVKPVPGQTFRASYNRAYVAPAVHYTNTQLYLLYTMDLGLVVPELAGNYYSFPYYFLGNDDLEEQSLNAYEVGYSATLAKGRLNLGAAFYINDGKGDFYWPQTDSYTSQNPPPGWPLPMWVLDAMIAAGQGLPSKLKVQNRGKVRNKGVELSADARFSRYITGYANYSWQAQPDSKDFNLMGINLPPNHRFNAGMDFDYRRYLGNVSVGYVDSAFWCDIFNYFYCGATKAYTVVNAGAGIRWGTGWKYTAMLKVSNLANVLVQNHILGDILKRQISGEFRARF